MIFWEKQIKTSGRLQCLFVCDLCKKESYVDKTDLKKRTTPYCKRCYTNTKEFRDKRSKSLNNKPTIQKLCFCGKDFVTKNTRKIYCSKKCAEGVSYGKRVEEKRLIAKEKFDEFAKTHKIILADLKFLESIGLHRIKSGPKKGQLCLPVAQS